jgi:hypothetical protein
MGKTISGTHTLGVTLSVNLTIIKGTITTTGTPALYGSAAKIWTISNKGEIASTGVGINLAGGAKITNAAHAAIRGGSEAIYARKAATINNAGTIAISSSYGDAIVLNGGAITNSAGGLISGGAAIVSTGNAALHILNQGVIAGTGAFGEAIAAAGTITNAASGTIIGHTGIRLSAGTISNAGLIEGTGTAGYAVILSGTSNTDIIEQKAGTIIGDIHGFLSGDSIDEAGLTITAERFSNKTLTLLNGTATIGTLQIDGFLNTAAFTLASDGHGGTDILLGSATFAGTYTGNTTYLSTQNTTLAATARLVSNAGAGLEGNTYRNWNLVNHGTIIAATFGAGVDFFGGGTITNSGLIEGAYGIYLTGGTITNFGTITGTRAAIDLAASSATAEIILKSGGVLNGAITGFETGDTIDLAAITATAETFANGILTLTNAGKVVDTIAIGGLFNSAAFKLGAAPGGGTDITIAPTETFSGHYGVALTLSSLFTSITSTGSISSASDGVFARGGRNWTLANSGTLAGNFYGVFINNAALTNTAHGLIEGRTGVFGSALNIDNAGTILGLATTNYGGYGISQIGSGVSVNRATGTIAGAKHGANVFGGSLTNAGSIIGQIGAYIIGGTLTNTGTIIGTGGGSYSTYRDAGLQIRSGFASNAAGGIIAGPNGVLLLGGSVTNAGLIEGLPGGQRRNIYGQVVSIASTGVTLNAGSLINLATGTISGATGIAFNGGTLSDAGTIATTLAGGNAITFGQGYATLILDPGNVIKGAIAGFLGGDIIDFAGSTITSEKFANGVITLSNGAAIVETLTLTGPLNQKDFTLIPQGTLGTELIIGQEILSGSYATGITLTAPTTITETATITGNANSISLGANGIYGSKSRNWTLLNQGLITGTLSTYVDAVKLLGAASVTNAASGTIIGDFIGVLAGGYAGNATLANAGTILAIGNGFNAAGAYLGGAGKLTNTGLIEGKTGVVLGAGSTLTNSGTIAATLPSGTAIKLASNGTSNITLDATSTLIGAIAGFAGADIIDFSSQSFTSDSFAAGTLTLFNAGVSLSSLVFAGSLVASEFTLASDNAGGTKLLLGPELLTGTYQYGITLSAAHTSIASTALVEVLSGHAGPGNPSGYALVDNSGTGHTIINSGRVIDTFYNKSGAFLGADTLINNAGATLSGAAGVKIFGQSGAPASIANAGTIIGIRPGGYGLNETYGFFSNAKTGTITGGSGINLYDVVATNTGTITGTTYSGVNVFGAYAAITNFAGATISGPTGVTFPTNGTVQNAGTIAGTGGTAIKFGTGAAKFIDDPGATLIGGVTATGTAAHLLELASAATAGTLDGLGETIIGFSTITFDAGAAFTLAGDIAGVAAGQSLIGFAANDKIILDNFSATSFSAIAGGIALKNAGGSITLDIATTGAGAFSIHAAGGATTITTTAAPLAAGAIITHGALTAPPMTFLRPNGWAPSCHPEAALPAPNPAAKPSPVNTAAPTLAGWLTLDPTSRPAIPAITLHAG